jgi:hypothetical protein
MIYAERNDSIFKILIKNKNDNKISDRIKKGELYNFDLRQIFPDKNSFPGLKVSQLKYMNSTIKIEEKCHNKLYVIDNLDSIGIRD